MIKARYTSFALVCLALIGLAAPLAAQSRSSDIAQAKFLPGWQLPDGRHIAGIRLDLAPEWKTYWRVPGDSGIAPTLRMQGPGLRGIEVLWPEPQLYIDAGLLTIGYADRVVVPFVLHGVPSEVEGRLDIGVCNDICVPMSFAINGTIPENSAPDPQLLAALAAQPLTATEAGIEMPQCELLLDDEGFAVEIELDLAQRAMPEQIVIEPTGRWFHVIPRALMQIEGNRLIASADFEVQGESSFGVAREDVRVTLLGNGRAIELQGCF